jgi:zinc/manganese transport system permease protein
VRLAGALCLAAVAIAVSLAAMTIGAILSTALLVGPAAAALRLTNKPGLVIAWSAGIGLAATWLGILLAYDSYYWGSAHRGWPVSFFVVTLIFAGYLAAQLADGHHGHGQQAPAHPAAAA